MDWFAIAHSLKQVIEFQWLDPDTEGWDEDDSRRDELDTARNRFYLPPCEFGKYDTEDVFVNWSTDPARSASKVDGRAFIVITDGGTSIDGVAEGDGRNRVPLGRKIVEYLFHVNLIVPDFGKSAGDRSYVPLPDAHPSHQTYRAMSVLPYQVSRRIAAFPVLSNIYKSRTDSDFTPDDIDDRNPIRTADVIGWARQYDWDSANLNWSDVAGFAFHGFLIVVRVIQEVDFGVGTVERGGQNKYSVGFKEEDSGLLLPYTLPMGGQSTPIFPNYIRARNSQEV